MEVTARVSGVGRVWALTAAMLLGALGLYLRVCQRGPIVASPFHLPWWALAILFFITESAVIHVRYGGQGQSIAINEIPLVLGLFFASPPEMLLGLLLGSSGALVRSRRQSPLQLAFNTSHFFLGGVVAVMVFQRVVVTDPLGPIGWSGAILATLVVTVLGHVAITVATVLSGMRPEGDRLRRVLSLGMTSTITVTTMGLVAVDVLWRDQRSALLLVVPTAMGFIAYRGWLEERSRSDSFELIYESTRMLHRSPEVDSAVVGLLTQARQMFRAERAELTLLPPGDDGQAVRTSLGPSADVEAMQAVAVDPEERAWAEQIPRGKAVFYPDAPPGVVSSLATRGVHEAMAVSVDRDDGGLMTIVVANRVGVSHFDHADLDLFESLAHSVSVVLESGTLERSLQQLKDLEAQLRHQAHHDPLTALANRAQFIERVELALEFAATDPSRLAVLFIDLDDFKVVNDGRGHTVGDHLLIAVSRRISEVLGASDSTAIARLGGDEFAVLLDCPSPEMVELVADRILDAIHESVVIDGETVQVSASIGIATGASGRFADELLRNADVAMYTAKSAGKNRYRVFSPDMHVAAIERHELTGDLQRAVERDEFLLHYQPIVDVATGTVAAFEALVRWRHPRRGMVSPVDFIPLAEETGLIVPIGRMVLIKAAAQVRAWRERYPERSDLAITVNVSAREMEQPTFVGDTLQVIAESGAPPGSIILEITESILVEHTEANIAKLKQLKSLGLRLALDDFGTGYSSLSFLAHLPVDLLKVAKPFVDGIGRSEQDTSFARAIVRLGQTVNLRLIAEGVERIDQFEELRSLGCDYVQGHYFSLALDKTDAEAVLERGLHIDRKVIPFPA